MKIDPITMPLAYIKRIIPQNVTVEKIDVEFVFQYHCATVAVILTPVLVVTLTVYVGVFAPGTRAIIRAAK